MPDPRPTRQRIIDEAMRLFGEQGYAATTIAQIEAAAGLSPGSGSLYRLFPSKQALLAELGQGEIAPVYRVVATWLADQTGTQAPARNWPALAAGQLQDD
jgi:AcrR family transcriptional regulator